MEKIKRYYKKMVEKTSQNCEKIEKENSSQTDKK